jgi:pimeloyl-ACP methyl ester carboxylesterase
MSLSASMAAGIALGLGGLPVWRETRRTSVSMLKSSAPGRFACLSQGETHYQWFGPQDGPVTVCVHGLTTPSFVWRGLLPYLIETGQRVLTYDLYGRGWSDAPRGTQTGAFHARQLGDLLTHEGQTAPVTLVGYSMGGAVVTSFAAMAPQKVRRLILLAPAGMGHRLGGLAPFAARTPLLGDWLFHMRYPAMLRAGIEAERALPGSITNIADLQLAELHRRGYLGAVLSSLRGQLAGPLNSEHQNIAESGLSVCAIWGEQDTVIPLTGKDTLTEWNSAARHVVLPGAGHGLTYTHANDVARAMSP